MRHEPGAAPWLPGPAGRGRGHGQEGSRAARGRLRWALGQNGSGAAESRAAWGMCGECSRRVWRRGTESPTEEKQRCGKRRARLLPVALRPPDPPVSANHRAALPPAERPAAASAHVQFPNGARGRPGHPSELQGHQELRETCRGSSALVTGHADHRREPARSQELTPRTGGQGLCPRTAVSTNVLRKPRTSCRQRGPGCLRLQGPLMGTAPQPLTPTPHLSALIPGSVRPTADLPCSSS